MGVCDTGVTLVRRHQEGHYGMEKRQQEDWKADIILSLGVSEIYIEDSFACLHTQFLCGQKQATDPTVVITLQSSVKLHFKTNPSMFIEQPLNRHAIDCT